jgi:hypothetical protein
MADVQQKAMGGSCLGSSIGAIIGLLGGGLAGYLIVHRSAKPEGEFDPVGAFDPCVSFVALSIGAGIGAVLGAISGGAFGAWKATKSTGNDDNASERSQ